MLLTILCTITNVMTPFKKRTQKTVWQFALLGRSTQYFKIMIYGIGMDHKTILFDINMMYKIIENRLTVSFTYSLR